MLERLWNRIFPKKIPTDSIIELVVEERLAHPGYISVYYGIYLKHTRIGMIDLRIGMNEELYYAGNIGYRIFEKYRGNHYAYYACKTVLHEAETTYHMPFVYITCSPGNIPSRKTIERLHGKFVEERNVPDWHWLYRRNEKVKDIYLFKF